jgi:Arc/MetJ-type ribon-helix-helix transcriptional regulator
MRKARKIPRNSLNCPPARGRAVRLSAELHEKVDAWACRQEDRPGRSEAVRRLLDAALGGDHARRQPAVAKPKGKSSRDRAQDRAQELASDVIDSLEDTGATSDARASRKGRLMKGPEEFRKLRRDRAAR